MRHFTAFLIVGLLFFYNTLVVGQERSIHELQEEIIPESLDANVDSLLHSWHAGYFSTVPEYCNEDDVNVRVPDSIYAMRLSKLPRVIPMTFNETVKSCIELYTDKRRGLMRYILGMANYFFPIIEPIIDANNLPLELKYLAVVESALNPVAQSRVGASGLWQFMLPTGKIYGLTINSLVDERLDPVKATEAACKYFKDMYDIYEDWNLVMASYNCGPGNVNKAIRRAKGKKDFWEIYPYLPKETRMYVPLFIAVNYAMNYACEHNLCAVSADIPLATDSIIINESLHFLQIAEQTNLDIEAIRGLNPQYKRDIIPGNTQPSVLKLPADVSFELTNKMDSVYSYQAEVLLWSDIQNYSPDSIPANPQAESITHTVAQGENIYLIANRYGVTPKEIRQWNRLSSYRLAKGRKLKLNVDNGGFFIAEVKKVEADEKKTSAQGSLDKFITYKVQKGDSLFAIAKKHPGISAHTIKDTNDLSGTHIYPGQILKIPVI